MISVALHVELLQQKIGLEGGNRTTMSGSPGVEGDVLVEAKLFYKKLDSLLSKIQHTEERTSLLSSVLRDLVESFGQELSIVNGRLYGVRGNELKLLLDLQSPEGELGDMRVNLDYPPVKLLMDHKCYIFHSGTPGLDHHFEHKIIGGTDSAAILVGRNQRAVLAFGLKPGWERESLEFALNTIRHAIDHRFETAWIHEDLEEARLIQRSLFPKGFPEFAGYDIAARSITADAVGGDFFDFLEPDDSYIGIAFGDASGHGLPAALLVRDVVTGLRMGVEKDMKITPVIERLNRVIHRSTISTKFVSLFYGELEDNGNLMYINAGHIPPFLLGERGMQRLEIGGAIIGPLPDGQYKRGFVHVDRGAVLVIVSDGITENFSPGKEEFDDHRVAALIEEHRDAPADKILEAIFDESFEFGGKEWGDDATALVIKRGK